MTQAAIIDRCIRHYGMRKTLEQLIADIEKRKPLMSYEIQLVSDLRTALANYEARYESGEP